MARFIGRVRSRSDDDYRPKQWLPTAGNDSVAEGIKGGLGLPIDKIKPD